MTSQTPSNTTCPTCSDTWKLPYYPGDCADPFHGTGTTPATPTGEDNHYISEPDVTKPADNVTSTGEPSFQERIAQALEKLAQSREADGVWNIKTCADAITAAVLRSLPERRKHLGDCEMSKWEPGEYAECECGAQAWNSAIDQMEATIKENTDGK